MNESANRGLEQRASAAISGTGRPHLWVLSSVKGWYHRRVFAAELVSVIKEAKQHDAEVSFNAHMWEAEARTWKQR